MDVVEYISPYCKECDACGEEGCCSPLKCKQTETGEYCGIYLDELHFTYRMYKDIMKLIQHDEKYKQQIDEIWETNYNKTYRNEQPR